MSSFTYQKYTEELQLGVQLMRLQIRLLWPH